MSAAGKPVKRKHNDPSAAEQTAAAAAVQGSVQESSQSPQPPAKRLKGAAAAVAKAAAKRNAVAASRRAEHAIRDLLVANRASFAAWEWVEQVHAKNALYFSPFADEGKGDGSYRKPFTNKEVPPSAISRARRSYLADNAEYSAVAALLRYGKTLVTAPTLCLAQCATPRRKLWESARSVYSSGHIVASPALWFIASASASAVSFVRRDALEAGQSTQRCSSQCPSRQARSLGSHEK